MKKISNEIIDAVCNKWLYFNGDENGEQYIYPTKIYYNKCGELCYDGIYIHFDCELDEILIEEALGYCFADCFYITYMPSWEEWEDSPTQLVRALNSEVIDTTPTIANHFTTYNKMMADAEKYYIKYKGYYKLQHSKLLKQFRNDR